MRQLRTPYISPRRRPSSHRTGGHSCENAVKRYERAPDPASQSPSLSTAKKNAISQALTFLQPYQKSIHSILVVGSTVCLRRTSGSDIDIVIITTTVGHEKVCSAVFEKEIDESLNSEEKSPFEFTILTSGQTEELFLISSPFSFSIRHGVILSDDGYMLLLRNKRFPLMPGEKYYTTIFYEHIATQYFGLLKKLRSEARIKGCSAKCSGMRGECEGLQPAHQAAKLLMKMFYVTLPARGMIPLTKTDVIQYAKIAYGSQGEEVARKAISLMRDSTKSFCFDEWKTLKVFAVQLYREVLRITGLTSDVRNIIADAARITRGDTGAIRIPAMKNCVA